MDLVEALAPLAPVAAIVGAAIAATATLSTVAIGARIASVASHTAGRREWNSRAVERFHAWSLELLDSGEALQVASAQIARRLGEELEKAKAAGDTTIDYTPEPEYSERIHRETSRWRAVYAKRVVLGSAELVTALGEFDERRDVLIKAINRGDVREILRLTEHFTLGDSGVYREIAIVNAKGNIALAYSLFPWGLARRRAVAEQKKALRVLVDKRQ